MRIFADAADVRYFSKLARAIRLVPKTGRVTEEGIVGRSTLPARKVMEMINAYLISQGPVIFNALKIDVKKVCGYNVYHAEYDDEDEDAGISVIVSDCEGGTSVSVIQFTY